MPIHLIPREAWTGRDDPEDGDQAIRLHHLVSQDASRGIIGFASEAGVLRNKGRPGAKQGPAALRKALANLAAPADAQPFSDLGDVAVEGDDLEDGQEALATKIAETLGSHEQLTIFGGGHETAFGSYSGLARYHPDKQIGIINLDAHLDLRLAGEQGPSSGTPFTQIRELNPGKFDYLCIGVAKESNTVALLNRAKEWDVSMVTDHALIEDKHTADSEIAAMIDRSDLIYLTVCLDVLPHYQAPGVSAPAARGAPLSIVEYLVTNILQQCQTANRPVPVADVVELSPPSDIENATAKTAALLARNLLFR